MPRCLERKTGLGFGRLVAARFAGFGQNGICGTSHQSAPKGVLVCEIVRAIRADPMARAAFVRMFVVVFLLCMLASVLLSIWTPKRYSSMVRIEVQKEAPEARAGEAPQAIAGPDPYFLATQLKIIQSYSNLTNVIGKLRLDSKLAQQNGFTRWTMDETFAYLSKKISVQQTRGTSLI